ncbi:thiamine biosynthesis protein ThiS [Methanocella sp. CWC-04]|uniref:Thiamine biosynthesis protein ThiS n=1 Tax=Methanooceanicella nereidis TaxID=2052831 RepID=A0AAP2W8K7_9EURY|nr:MoaD/ThiS family protein [Methanocella sp. CWC-04]MCD1296126.1 thiamine biosynthesis protein ThiS [Methanocella sp. CWC-04]
MKIPVKIYAGKVSSMDVELPEGSTYIDLLDTLKINPETVIVFKNGTPVAVDSNVTSGNVDIMRVVSGG